MTIAPFTRHDSLSVAVIGGGIAGLICARTLMAHRLAVTVLNTGREPGGLISTRQADGYRFDDGGAIFYGARPSFPA